SSSYLSYEFGSKPSYGLKSERQDVVGLENEEASDCFISLPRALKCFAPHVKDSRFIKT
ncbi:hypothetical protein J6590_067551, partial [Homalodisca vitripennis]